ncbi:hypothetical protein ACFL6E_02445 [Candidatus Neomarinimicrobiota bacterium]
MKFKDATRKLISFNLKYQLVDRDDLPNEITTGTVDYRRNELESNAVFIYYSVLSKAFGTPKSFQAEALGEPNKEGRIPGIKVQWEYFLQCSSGSVIIIRTEDQLTSIQIDLLITNSDQQPTSKDKKCAKQFIDDLLIEVEGNRNSIISKYRKVDNIHSGGRYLLVNMYLQNYLSAEAISQYSGSIEQDFKSEANKYDARDKSVGDDAEKMNYVERHLMVCGSIYRSAILHYFIALEAFINLIIHGLLKSEFRVDGSVYERTLSLELKILLMPSLCQGFIASKFSIPENIMDKFKELRQLRNRIAHGSINDSIKSLLIAEDGYLFTLDLDKHTKDILPQLGAKLQQEHVDMSKDVTDTIIDLIISGLDEQHRGSVENLLLSEPFIPMMNNPEADTRLILI